MDINFFIDDFYTSKEIEETFKSYQNNLLKLILNNIKKLEVKLKNTNSKLKECNNMNTYKLYGELITANLYKINETHLDNIELENYYDNNSVISIPLDKAFSVSDNAKKYFKKYNKLKSAFDIVNKQKEEIELYSCLHPCYPFSSVHFSHSVMSDSLRPHGLQHARLTHPLPTPRTCSDSCPLSR